MHHLAWTGLFYLAEISRFTPMGYFTLAARRSLILGLIVTAVTLALGAVGLHSQSMPHAPPYLDGFIHTLGGAYSVGIGASATDPNDGALISVVRGARRTQDSLDAFHDLLRRSTTVEGRFYALVGLYIEGDPDFETHRHQAVNSGGLVRHKCDHGVVRQMGVDLIWNHLTSVPTTWRTDHKDFIEQLREIARDRVDQGA
jgi:hypothetical protein